MTERVERRRRIDRPEAETWAILRAFCHPWHPAVDTMVAEDGGGTRVFTVEGAAYRERRTYLSDSDRVLRYTHLAGIAGADRYDARIQMHGAEVVWSAEIEGPRAADIAAGTGTIFDMGLEALPTAPLPPTEVPMMFGGVFLQDKSLADPAIGVTATGGRPGPLCLFLHGIGGNRSNWRDQLAAVGPITQAAAMDLRGYGDSALGPAQTTLEDHFADILRVRDALGGESLILCGLSFGAWIAASFAERHPEVVAGLVVSGGCTGMSEATPETRQAFLESRLAPLDAGQTPADFAEAVIPAITGPDASEDVIAEMVASMTGIPSATYRDAVKCFTNPPGRLAFDRLNMPVLVMTGAHDPLAPPQELRAVASQIHRAASHPDVVFEIIEGAGHLCNLEAPEAYNAPLRSFVARVAAKAHLNAETTRI